MYQLLQKASLQCDPEWTHDATMALLKNTQHNILSAVYSQKTPKSPVSCFGIDFKNPIGLAAGLDKNGDCIDAFAKMGFGFVEVGTVTPLPQSGNPKPRMFRLPEYNAIINRMGFNNKGVDYLVEQVKQRKSSIPIGINIGKNKTTEEDKALDDYLICLDKVYAHADYVTVNISSPNTPGLRNLQYGDALNRLLEGLKERQVGLANRHDRNVPLLVKIAPDLSDDELEEIATAFLEYNIDGVIATNTTLERSWVDGHKLAGEAGGLSGQVLCAKSTELTKKLSSILQQQIPIIGVGGISNYEDAQQRFAAGATLLQVYTSFIYKGPDIISELIKR